MNKRIILSLGLAALLSSSLFAGNMSCKGEHCDVKSERKGCMKHNNHRGFGFMKYVMSLDLSDEQRNKIGSMMKERMKDMPKMSDAFSDKEFNKELFIKQQKEKRENRVEKKAQMIESIYKILTPVQKKELKKMLDEKMQMRGEFMKCGKN